jgi:membrane protein DedA with SNARE-associated domain
MNEILARLARHGLWIVFGNVVLEQVGAPLPALPTLIVSGALAANSRSLPAICATPERRSAS